MAGERQSPPNSLRITTVDIDNSHGDGSLSQSRTRTSDSNVPKQPEDAPAYLIELTGDQSSQLVLNSPEDLKQALQRDNTADRKKVIVLHGLPVDFVSVLRDELDLPAELVEAIAGRRTYRPQRREKRGVVASFEYPELVTSVNNGQLVLKQGGSVVEGMTARDVLGDPPIYPISAAGDQVLFCRATLWVRGGLSVLFLDRSLWNSLSFLQKAHRPFAVTKACDCADEKSKHSWDLGFTSKGKDLESLEQRIRRNLEDDPVLLATPFGCLSIPAYDSWLDLFDTLSTNLQSYAPDQPFYTQMLSSLENNVEVFRNLSHQDQDLSVTLADWQALLARVDQRLRSATTLIMGQASEPTSKSQPDNSDKQAASETDEKQRSLDRVSYLGGILLPITVTTGIMGMSDPFSPADNQFWIFWAVSVPFTILTLLVIYADSIRTSEVWLEVAGEEPEPSDSEKPSTPQLEEGVPYSYRTAVPPSEDGTPYSPALVVHRRFGRFKHPAWKREQLGWIGACKSIFQFYQFKGMQAKPPGRPVVRKTATF